MLSYKITIIKNRIRILLFILFIIISGTITRAQAPDGWLYTQGNKIYKSDGTIFAGAGVNIFDTRSGGNYLPNPYSVDVVKNHIDIAVGEWGADFLRLCLAFEENNSPLVSPTYLDEVAEIVEYIGDNYEGTYVMVTDYWDYTLRDDPDRIPLDATMPMLKAIAKKLSPYPHVLFGICNEPRGSGSQADNEKAWTAMNAATDTIRSAEKDAGSAYQHIVVAQGLRSYGKHLAYYIDHPITAGGGVNIAYESHPYLHIVSDDDPNKRDIDIVCLNPSDHIPVIIGEYGAGSEGYMLEEDCDYLVEECEKRQIPYLAWAFHSSQKINMITDLFNPQPTAWGRKIMGYLENHNLGAGTGIRLINFVSNPTSIYYETTAQVTFSSTIIDQNGVGIQSVKLDLSAFGAGEVNMVPNGDNYSYSYTVQAGTSPGDKEVTLTVTTAAGDEISKTGTIKIIKAADDVLILYNDAHTEITGINNWNATVKEVSGNSYEGTKHYELDGTGTTFSFNQIMFDPIDFSKYESLSFATILNSVKIRLYIMDVNGDEFEGFVLEANSNTDYQVYTFSISDIEGIDLTQVEKIKFSMYRADQTGVVFLDDVKLFPFNANSTLSVTPSTLTLEATQGSQGKITINSSENWTVSSTAGWLNFSSTNGSGNGIITVTTSEVNASGADRVTNVIISSPGLSDQTVTVTQKWENPNSVDNSLDSEVALYPNPATSEIHLDIPEPANIEIINLQGISLIKRSDVTSSDIDISALSKGVYFVSIEMRGTTIRQRIIKE